MKMSVRALFFVLLFPVFSYAEDEVRFLALADIHFDPFIACYEIQQKPCPLVAKLEAANASEWRAILRANDHAPFRYRLDSNYPILAATLSRAKEEAQEASISFVLVLGDLVAHDYRHYYKKYAQDKSRAHYEMFVKKTLDFLTQEIANAFPGKDVYMVVGNNDSYHGDYYSDPNGLFFSDMAAKWSSLIKDSANRAAMRQLFPTAGYYAVNLPQQPRLRLIMLNSVLFSTKARGRNVNAAAEQELTWLHKELAFAKANHQQVLMAMHIPKTVDIYLFSRLRLLNLMVLWKPRYLQVFAADLQHFAPVIAGVFSGHLHSDWMQYVDGVPTVGVPSISPIFGNNPTFKIYTYSLDASGQLVFDDGDTETVQLDFSSFVH